MDALIGSTGFVGGHLRGQHEFLAHFASSTIATAYGKSFDTVVCAAAPGSMFEANRAPDVDAARMSALMDSLSRVQAKRFVLISSIAVLADFAGGDDEATTRFQSELAYGRNRHALEIFCAETFPEYLIVRLPALFGSGLKKNFVFDILNPMPSMLPEERYRLLQERLPAALKDEVGRFYSRQHSAETYALDRPAYNASAHRTACDEAVGDIGMSAINFTSPDSTFQYYNMARLWSDIRLSTEQGLRVIHLAPEPINAGRVYALATGRDMPATGARVHAEDMRTRHADLWARRGHYIATADDVAREMSAFFASARGAQ